MDDLVRYLERFLPSRGGQGYGGYGRGGREPFAPSQSVDWSHWVDCARLDVLTEAIPLMFGQEPERWQTDYYLAAGWWDHERSSTYIREYRRIMRVIRAAEFGQLGEEERHYLGDERPNEHVGWMVEPIEFVEWAQRQSSIGIPSEMVQAVSEKRQRQMIPREALLSVWVQPDATAKEPFALPEEVTRMKAPNLGGFTAYVALRLGGLDVRGERWAEAIAFLSKRDTAARYLAGTSGKFVTAYDALRASVGSEPGRWGQALDALRQAAGLDGESDGSG